jgi:molecular chaperone DnaK (HSP70)
MSWRTFKNLPRAEKLDEANYVLGIDLGEETSALAFYNAARGAAEPIDISGGYGKPQVPTALQYDETTREWTFGEYALLNQGQIFTNLISRLGSSEYIDVAGRSRSVAHVLALFVKDLIAGVKGINPRAVVRGIVCAVPDYLEEPARAELGRVFALAGYEKELISLVPQGACAVANAAAADAAGYVLVLDMGARRTAGWVYDIQGSNAVAVAGMFDNALGMATLDAEVHALLASFLPNEQRDADALTAFVHQSRDVLFQKAIRQKPAKLYYNFMHPPVAQEITHEQISEITAPYEEKLRDFISRLLEKNLTGEPLDPDDITQVICVGGGFDMLWAREAVQGIFGEAVAPMKVPKLQTAEGAAYIAAGMLGMAKPAPSVEDMHQITVDIGLADDDDFMTLIEKYGFWWQAHPPGLLLLNCEITGAPITLTLSERDDEFGARTIQELTLDGLPPRTKGTTRLMLSFEFTGPRTAKIHIRDAGFGEIFPAGDWAKTYEVGL